ncbi:MAG: hypothetical protein ACKVKL_06055 [Pseudomonadales bacterium]|jgi:hypothetical protein|tara:strand:- start:4595 stop:5107 length:513 start_codon:yes stop_codon:yes gene_type:complete
MSLQDWASIAEIVGGIAVIVSLIYVGLQVNDSTSAIRSSAASDATKTMQSWYLEMGRNRQASDIWYNAMTSAEPLPARDEFQFMMSMHTAILGMQNSYLLSKEGTLDEEFREAVTTAIVAVKDMPGMARYWKQRKGFFHTGFAEYVDGLLVRDSIETLDIYKRLNGETDH